ncbi:MAG: DNA-binding transcriptional LysR family regulator [Parasphingorhabdus sp.]|jgi:DNA-binding transcriptional LysR family regulator
MAARINDRLIEAFQAVVTVGTTTAAADVLNTSQSSISRSIHRLESVVQISLFDRNKGRLQLTREGQILYEEVDKSYIGLERIEQTARALRLKQKGHVGIVCMPVLSYGFISDVVESFTSKHPGVNITVESQLSPIIAELITAQRFDIALAEYPGDPPGVTSEIFANPDQVCLLPKSHPLAEKRIISIQDLNGQAMISFSPLDPIRKRLDKLFARNKVKPNILIETPISESVGSMVARGLGMAIINPFTALNFSNSHNVVMRKFEGAEAFESKLWRPLHRPSSSIIASFEKMLFECRDNYLSRISEALDQSGT